MSNITELPLHTLARSVAACLRPHPRMHLASAAAMVLALATPALAPAATLTVTNTNDSGAGSLRQAVLDANALAGADEILFDSSVSGTIVLTSGQILITDSLNVAGPGPDVLTLDGNLSAPIFEANIANADVTLSGLTLTRGKAASGLGGGVAFEMNVEQGHQGEPTLTVQNSVITGNREFGIGGRINHPGRYASYPAGNSGHVIIESSTVSENTGGGVAFESNRNLATPTLLASNSVISGNGGPAVFGSSSSLVGYHSRVYWSGQIDIQHTVIFNN